MSRWPFAGASVPLSATSATALCLFPPRPPLLPRHRRACSGRASLECILAGCAYSEREGYERGGVGWVGGGPSSRSAGGGGRPLPPHLRGLPAGLPAGLDGAFLGGGGGGSSSSSSSCTACVIFRPPASHLAACQPPQFLNETDKGRGQGERNRLSRGDEYAPSPQILPQQTPRLCWSKMGGEKLSVLAQGKFQHASSKTSLPLSMAAASAIPTTRTSDQSPQPCSFLIPIGCSL